MKRTEPAWEFLLYSYFGLTKSDFENENTIKEKCIARAYLDLDRTISYRLTVQDLDKMKKLSDQEAKKAQDYIEAKAEYQAKIAKLIIGQLDKLDEKRTQELFDDWHEKTCGKIIDEEPSELLKKKLSHGQAQKWLNMSMKYMWLLGLLDEYTQFLHVPVDSFIIEAVWDSEVPLPLKDGANRKKKYKHPANYVKAWSSWGKTDYKDFSEKIRTSELIGNDSPITWEGTAWIEQSVKTEG